jgi:hypothetical protein
MNKRYVLLVALLVLAVGCTPEPRKPALPKAAPFAAFATTSPIVKPEQPQLPVAKPPVQPAPTPVPEQKPPVENVPPEPQPPVIQNPAVSINLAVPFRPQAPFADWSEPYENGCEEASIIMVDYYLRGATLSAQQMKDAIDAQIAWQEKHFGGHFDLPIVKVKELAAVQYPYKFEIINPLTIDTIRKELQKGLPVIVPTAGRELGNPYFTSPGPIYHMLVIKGYTADGRFITNDPGTKRGADYVYTSSALMNAIHDWTGEAADGSAIGLVMYK